MPSGLQGWQHNITSGFKETVSAHTRVAVICYDDSYESLDAVAVSPARRESHCATITPQIPRIYPEDASSVSGFLASSGIHCVGINKRGDSGDAPSAYPHPHVCTHPGAQAALWTLFYGAYGKTGGRL